MTIYTTENLLNQEKKEKPTDTFDVEIHISEKRALNPDLENDTPYRDTTYPVVSVRRVQKQKRRCLVQLCLLLGMVLGLSLCVIGSVFLYKNLSSSTSRYRGRCGVGLIDMSKYQALNMTDDSNSGTTSYQPLVRGGIEEEIDIEGSIETLTTPAQLNASAATFRHDFDRNMTAIRDMLNDLCYFVPFINAFGNGMIPSPHDFSLYLDNKDPMYNPMVNEQHEYFERKALVEDPLSLVGPSLTDLCQNTRQYTAEPRQLYQYELATTTPTYTTANPLSLDLDSIFRMYPGGSDIYSYHIYTIEFGDY